MTSWELLDKNITDTIENNAHVVGRIKGEYARGGYLGISQILVLVEDLRQSGKPCNVLVMLPDCEDTHELVKKKSIISAYGILTSSYTFSGDSVKHIFLEPSGVEELPEDYKLEPNDEFYLNYTLYNRFLIRGEISTEPTHKLVKSVDRGLHKFKLKFKDNTQKLKTINCTLWDTVNDLKEITKGSNILIIGSLNTTNRLTLGLTDKIEEKDYTTYNMLIQKVIDLDNSPEKLAELIYGDNKETE